MNAVLDEYVIRYMNAVLDEGPTKKLLIGKDGIVVQHLRGGSKTSSGTQACNFLYLLKQKFASIQTILVVD
jgi:hypothetical protein